MQISSLQVQVKCHTQSSAKLGSCVQIRFSFISNILLAIEMDLQDHGGYIHIVLWTRYFKGLQYNWETGH